MWIYKFIVFSHDNKQHTCIESHVLHTFARLIESYHYTELRIPCQLGYWDHFRLWHFGVSMKTVTILKIPRPRYIT